MHTAHAPRLDPPLPHSRIPSPACVMKPRRTLLPFIILGQCCVRLRGSLPLSCFLFGPHPQTAPRAQHHRRSVAPTVAARQQPTTLGPPSRILPAFLARRDVCLGRKRNNQRTSHTLRVHHAARRTSRFRTNRGEGVGRRLAVTSNEICGAAHHHHPHHTLSYALRAPHSVPLLSFPRSSLRERAWHLW